MNERDQQVNTEEDEGQELLTAQVLSDVLYLQVASDAAFDSIEGATRRTPTEFVVYPFDGPSLLVTVAPVSE